jgi:hypothetical protein
VLEISSIDIIPIETISKSEFATFVIFFDLSLTVSIAFPCSKILCFVIP